MTGSEPSPDFPRRLQEALRLQQQGQAARALAIYAELLGQQPDHADLLHLSGLALAETGDPTQALERVQAAVSRQPENALYLANLGLVLVRLGREAAAVEAYRRALKLGPDQSGTWYNLGNALAALGRHGEAAEAYQWAVAVRPDYGKAWINLSGSLRELGRCDEARRALEQALASAPHYPPALSNLANLLRECGDPFRAVALCEEALRYAPDHHRAWNNLGSALRESGRLDAALRAYERALALRPEHPEAHLNLALALLAKGEYRRGWQEYEWRWQASRENADDRGRFAGPPWRGEPLAGGTILLHAEQGLGDALQFVRYAPLVAERGGQVWLECQPELVRLFARLPGVERVLARGEPLPAADWHCPLMSLPLAFGTTVESIPARVPYLHPDPAAVDAWRARLGAGPTVGLVWAGNPRPHDPVSALIDRRRSLDLERLADLGAVPGVRWVSLQKGRAAEQVASAPFPLSDPMAEVRDFLDTAALVAALDLVITVDTSVAHLAGALARPTWILSRFDACWRWLEGRDDSPWYPTLRLFRQPAYGDWDSVLVRVTEALRGWAATVASTGAETVARDARGTAGEGPRPATGAPAADVVAAGQALHRAGVRAAQVGDLQGALVSLRQAVTRMPGNAACLADLGLVWAGLGQPDQAAACYRNALDLDPTLAPVWFNLGNALSAAGRLPEAEDAYRRALALNDGYPRARVNLANLLRQRGELAAAAEVLAGALAAEPLHVSARSNLALVLSELGRRAEALATIEPLIAQNPAEAGPWQQYGVVLHHSGRNRDAAEAFRQAIARDPGRVEAWINLAGAELASGRVAEAQTAAERAVDLAPEAPGAWKALAAACLRAEATGAAVTACRRVTELAPTDASAWSDLATALRGAGQFEEAIAACDHALGLAPGAAAVLANRAGARWECGRPAEAAADCEQALAVEPDSPDTWNTLGIARNLLRDLAGAEAAYRQALALDPGHAAAHMNLSLVRLTRGAYEEGWREYEWRWEGARGGLQGRRELPVPQWRGEPLAGEAILLHAEQGLGDALQFVRYAPLVARRGGRVFLECYPELVRLFRRLPGIERVLATGEPLPPVAWHCPLLSLPLAFGTRLDSIPAELPYLRPDPDQAARWAERLARLPGRKVGLVWAGSPRPHDPVSHRIDRRRSLRLAELAPLLALPGATFVSLQKGPGAAQAAGSPVVDFTAELNDFEDTAALVAGLDLVIAVDTSVAHLAGGLGRPVWLLSRFDACWRWLEEREDSPWYPGLRLFRQPVSGDWASVVARLSAALRDWLREAG